MWRFFCESEALPNAWLDEQFCAVQHFGAEHGGAEHGDAQHGHTKVRRPRWTIVNST
jgi:hypothetical protein